MEKYYKQLIGILLWFPLWYVLLTFLRSKKEAFVITKELEPVVWIIFITFFVLFIYSILGLGIRSFFMPNQFLKSKRHLITFIFSLGVVVNHYTYGENITWFQGDLLSDLFDLLLCFSDLYFLILLIMILFYFEHSLDEENGKKVKKSTFKDDDPIGKEEDDVLRIGEFAEALAKQINGNNGKLTIGIFGPWGSGKSSLFEMMKNYLPANQSHFYFTPWYFGENNHEIIPKFLEQLAESLKEHQKYNVKLEKELKKYANFFHSLQYRSSTGVMFSLGELFRSFLQVDKSLEDTKKNISEMLKESEQNILVFIDDLDRLDAEEIAIVFKLVRLVCDFPNITYVLALDEDVVSYSLGQLYGGEQDEEKIKERGRRYLEKFIQVPIYLPQSDNKILKNLLLEGVSEILSEYKIQSGFLESNQSDIYPIIDIKEYGMSIRNIKRYLNLVRFFVPLLEKEVFIDDLLYLLLLKVSAPGLYDWIRKSPHLVLQVTEKAFKENKEVNKIAIEYKQYRKLIEELFPNMGYAYGGVVREKGNDFLNGHMRISSRGYFQKYFMYATPYKEIPQKLLKNFYESLLDLDLDLVKGNLRELEDLYNFTDIYGKMELDSQYLNADQSKVFINVLKKRYNEADNYKIKSELLKVLLNIYRYKNEVFSQSAIFEEPINLYLLLSLYNNIVDLFKDKDIPNKIKELILALFKEVPISQSLRNYSEKEWDYILEFWINNEEDPNIKQAILNEYITAFDKYQRFISSIWANNTNLEDLKFYQKILTYLGTEIIERYNAEYDKYKETIEYKEPFIKLINGENQLFSYLTNNLANALEITSSRQPQQPVIMEQDFDNLVSIFLNSKANSFEKDKLQQLIDKIYEYNKSLKE